MLTFRKISRVSLLAWLMLAAWMAPSAARGASPATRPAVEPVPAKELARVLSNARQFLRTAQTPDGAFGAEQPHLQASLAVLALLSMGHEQEADDLARIERAVDYLIRGATGDGDLGDDTFRSESHALAMTAILCATPRLRGEELRARAARATEQALKVALRIQDKSSSSPARGGWKMEGSEGRENDRRASAWMLLSLQTARLYGWEVKQADLDRGVRYLLGSFKATAEQADQVGGLSVDLEGLSVPHISGMGGWALARLSPWDNRLDKNVSWLAKHPPQWMGPAYFHSTFFQLRALRASVAGRGQFDAVFRRAFMQLRDAQNADGAIGVPPGEAQNNVAMGPVFPTAMAILILNAHTGTLLFDTDFRVPNAF